MRFVLTMALALWGSSLHAGLVDFYIQTGASMNFVSDGTTNSVSFTNPATFTTTGATPVGLNGKNGAIGGGTWSIGAIAQDPNPCNGNFAGQFPCTQTASLTGAPTTFTLYQSGTSGVALTANLAVNSIQTISTPGTASGSVGQVGFNLQGAWSVVGGGVGDLNSDFLALYNETNASAVIQFAMRSGETLIELLNLANTNSNDTETRAFQGYVQATPEPGFYGVLAAGLGTLLWGFRRRRTEA